MKENLEFRDIISFICTVVPSGQGRHLIIWFFIFYVYRLVHAYHPFHPNAALGNGMVNASRRETHKKIIRKPNHEDVPLRARANETSA
jgi:hypothetical protein